MKTLKSNQVLLNLGGEEVLGKPPLIGLNERVLKKFGEEVIFSRSSSDQFVPSRYQGSDPNQLLACLNIGYSYHVGVRLSPDILWMLVIQGIADCIRFNPEGSRDKLVLHHAKEKIHVREDRLIRDSAAWENIPQKLLDGLTIKLGDKSELLQSMLPTFSTTSKSDFAAFQVGLLDVYSSYFEYSVSSKCHIPKILLEGSTADWENFNERLRKISKELNLGWWINHLIPIVKEIAQAASGALNLDFWQSMYKLDGESGGPFINGWIINFFPFIKASSYPGWDEKKLYPNWEIVQEMIIPEGKRKRVYGKNPFLGRNQEAKKLTENSFNEGLSSVSFIWEASGIELKMEMISGFIGASFMEKENCLYPSIGWLVRKRKES